MPNLGLTSEKCLLNKRRKRITHHGGVQFMKKTIGAITALIIAGFILAGSASAFGMLGNKNGTNFLLSNDVKASLDDALTNNDYEAFSSIHQTNFPNTPVISEEQFAKMAERHAFQQNVNAAIESGNYTEWKTLVENSNDPFSQRMLETITAENFSLVKEWTQTQEKLREIEAKLGFEPKKGFSFHAGMGPGMKMHGREMINARVGGAIATNAVSTVN
jgi:hypothetical protein